jgi:CrcB protein
LPGSARRPAEGYHQRLRKGRMAKETNGRSASAPQAAPVVVAQATLRPRSELECERLIRLAHGRGIASATAYRGPDDGAGPSDAPIFLMLLDETELLEGFLPELRRAAPEAPISVIREEAVHVSPEDFLRGGVLEPKPFRTEARHAAWVFLGGSLGAAARLLLEGIGSYLTPLHAVFPFGTMAANVAGSFAIAIFGTLLFERFVGEKERMFWVLGFLGSLTTFSTYVQQTAQGWEASHFLATLYGGGSIFLGLLAAVLGLRLTRRLL